MTVLLHAVVAGVQNAPSADLDVEHGRAQHVPGVERVELQTAGKVQVDGLMIIYQLYLVHTALQLGLSVEHVLGIQLAAGAPVLDGHEAEVVAEQQPYDRLGGVGHEDPAAEARPLGEVGKARGVVQVEVRHEEDVDGLGVDAVEEGQAGHAVVAGVDTAVQEDRRAPEGQEVARPANLLAGPEGRYLHRVLHLFVFYVGRCADYRQLL